MLLEGQPSACVHPSHPVGPTGPAAAPCAHPTWVHTVADVCGSPMFTVSDPPIACAHVLVPGHPGACVCGVHVLVFGQPSCCV